LRGKQESVKVKMATYGRPSGGPYTAQTAATLAPEEGPEEGPAGEVGESIKSIRDVIP